MWKMGGHDESFLQVSFVFSATLFLYHLSMIHVALLLQIGWQVSAEQFAEYCESL